MSTKETISAKRTEIGANLFAAAVKLSRREPTSNKWHETYTLKSARDMLPHRRRIPKRYTLAQATEIVWGLATAIHKRRVDNHLRHRHDTDPLLVPLRKRLQGRRVRMVDGGVRLCLRQYTNQSEAMVTAVRTFPETTCQLHKEMDWIDYKSAGRRYGVVDAYYRVWVHGWILLPSWLRDCDGLLTLGAIRQPEDEQENEEVWRARWARSGAGDVVVTEGFIVKREHDGRSYTAHAKTLNSARATITRQLPEWLAAQTEREVKRAERLERIKQRLVARLAKGTLNGCGQVSVTLADSRRAGNCPDGTQAWVERHFPGRTTAPVSDVLAIDDQRERVLLACAAAIRRESPELFQD